MLTKEIIRTIIIFAIAQFLNLIISFFFNAKEKLEENDKNLRADMIEEYLRQIEFLKRCFKFKFIIGFIFVLLLHLTIIYFFIIFTCIYSFNHYQFYLVIYFLIAIAIYIILYTILFFILALLRLISLKFESSFIFKISTFIAESS